MRVSTDWYYRFRAALRPELRGLDLEAILARAPGRLGEVDLPHYPRIGDHDAYGPVMGPATSFDGARFRGFCGAAAIDGELCLAIWDRDLHEVEDGGDDILDDPGASRLDLLLGLMSWATVGPRGEVVGCIASDGDAFAHAHPLVRCGDGLVRLCESEERPHSGSEEAALDDRGDVPIPGSIPLEFVRVVRRSWAILDCAGLRGRFEPIDLVPERRAIDPIPGAPARPPAGIATTA